jgi:hypothetical protein
LLHTSADVDQQFDRVVDALTKKFTGVHHRDAVTEIVDEARRQLEGEARVTTYLPVLATRRATDRLAGREVTS